MKNISFIRLGAANLFIAVCAGAFGAHALKTILSSAMLSVWQTAVNYHMVHGLGLVLIGILVRQLPGDSHVNTQRLRQAGWAMSGGIVLFCGSLYTMALTDLRLLGAITPFGGILFLAAWFILASRKF
jgi:uncharacterized membrane protein YgdD (TMEM256/DUF423 family)